MQVKCHKLPSRPKKAGGSEEVFSFCSSHSIVASGSPVSGARSQHTLHAFLNLNDIIYNSEDREIQRNTKTG